MGMTGSMTVVGAALLVAFAVALIVAIRSKRPAPGPGTVRAARRIPDREAAFYWTLRKAVGERRGIAVQVPLAYVLKRQGLLPLELYSMPGNGPGDFLLLRPRSWEPVLGIELDDSTHPTPTRRDRDRRQEALFRPAGIPLLRWPAGRARDVEEIARAVWKALPGAGGEERRERGRPEPG